jgi:hypothetical protein
VTDGSSAASVGALQDLAKLVSKEAIIKRWQKLSPDNQGEPNFVQSFKVEPLTDFDTETVTPARIGPYHAQTGGRVWMTQAPFSFGLTAPPELRPGGAW